MGSGLAGTLTATLLLGCAAPAFAHGGEYRSPAAPRPDDDGGGGRRPPGGTATDPGWENWWSVHRDRLLEAARRRAAEDARVASAGGLGTTVRVGGTEGVPAPSPSEPPGEVGATLRMRILAALTRALSDPDSEVRSSAAVALGKVGFPRSLLPLAAALDDLHPDVRDASLLAMGMIGDPLALDLLRGALFDPSVPERTRGFAAVAVGLTGGEEATALLLDFISPAADGGRMGGIRRTDDLLCCAMAALGRTGVTAAVPVLRRELATAGRQALRVRCFAAVALARLGDRGAVPLLLQGLSHDDARMRQSCAVALGVVAGPADPAVVSALARTAAADADAGTREFALHALGRVGGAEARGALRTAWSGGRSTDRHHAALALAVMGDEDAGPALLGALRGAGGIGEWGALALSLGLLRHGPAVPDLLAAAGAKGDQGRRGRAFSALSLMGERALVPLAKAVLLDDSDPRFHFVAAQALRGIGDRTVVPDLASRARSGKGVRERCDAAYLLGVLGGEEAARTLLLLLEEPGQDGVLRMHAVAGLGVLADRSSVPLLADLGADTNFLLPAGPLMEIQTFL